jgi:isoleucyl-tRNA synthetase
MKRFGRWADMEGSYRTMDLDFMESVWWVFKELWDKNLIYEGYRSMLICPRCETTLSQSEVAEGYKDIKDLSVTIKLELEDEPGTFILAWTTTPWTLIGNVALAIGKNIDYVKILYNDENGNAQYFILAKAIYEIKKSELFPSVKELKTKEVPPTPSEIMKEFKGKDLIGKKYKPLFDYYAKDESLKDRGNGWQVYGADFVTTEEGTGVVHIAPAFGEDDLNLGKEKNLPFIQHLGMDGIIKKEAGEFAGLSVKPKDDCQKTDVEIIKYLAKKNLLFAKEKYEHSYPHCWRCETPLINYATSSWFVSITKIKEKILKLSEGINWTPKHIKEGRFGNWLEGARDWSISRQRYWASVMPIWKCEKCQKIKVIGSVKELEDLSGEKIADIHKHRVDKITFQCADCEATMKRIPDVLDTWFDSGSMPYAQMHYPFENKEKFEAGFPAEFIAEGIDQTRCWFYYLHVIASGIKDSAAFKNVIVNGIVLAEDGKKMSKRLKNYPDPEAIFQKYGADALRFYLLSSPVMSAENLNFKETEVAELVRGIFRMLWNSYSFFILYAQIDKWEPKKEALGPVNLLDRWILSELNLLIQEINKGMENYDLNRTIRLFPKFIDNLSNWYIRRSRKRFWKSEDDVDKENAYQTLYTVLVELSKLMAPFTPFIAEEIYKNMTDEESVHLADFPKADEKLIDEKLNKNMSDLREIISIGLQERAKNGIKVRQPLAKVILGQKYANVFDEFINKTEWSYILTEELNVKGASLGTEVELVGLDTEITADLKLEGQAREIIRFIQEMRKEAGYEVDNRIQIGYKGGKDVFAKFGSIIAKEALATEFKNELFAEPDLQKSFKVDKEEIMITIKR